jgi:hypothetical protein
VTELERVRAAEKTAGHTGEVRRDLQGSDGRSQCLGPMGAEQGLTTYQE